VHTPAEFELADTGQGNLTQPPLEAFAYPMVQWQLPLYRLSDSIQLLIFPMAPRTHRHPFGGTPWERAGHRVGKHLPPTSDEIGDGHSSKVVDVVVVVVLLVLAVCVVVMVALVMVETVIVCVVVSGIVDEARSPDVVVSGTDVELVVGADTRMHSPVIV
jgi:hypothetical protein